jgi:hypothetical protein
VHNRAAGHITPITISTSRNKHPFVGNDQCSYSTIISKMLDPYLTSHAPCKCNTIPMCPQISIPLPHAAVLYDLGFSFFSFHSADRPTPETLTTLNRTPGISPFALPLRPNPASRTSSFSSTKLRQPSLGTISHQPLSSSSHLILSSPNSQSILKILGKCLCRTHRKQ